MKQTAEIIPKNTVLAIGLMSGTSADGMDAALVEITGSGLNTKVRQRAFVTLPYADEVRSAILRLAEGDTGGAHELCMFHFLLGKLSLDACRMVCESAGITAEEIDFVGSHGQTLYHAPNVETYIGHEVRGTLQMGEPSVICEGMGCPVVSDFRVRDLAAGGSGAPLVPYTEFLLYHSEDETVGLQNIGGIGNLTILPRGGHLETTFAFDTGPGNMVMDALTVQITCGKQRFDDDGRLAAQGQVNEDLLRFLMMDPYLYKEPPKTTGREEYGKAYLERLNAKGKELGVSLLDQLATATRFTPECVRLGIERFCPEWPDRLIIGGGGSRNQTLLNDFKQVVAIPVQTQEEIGLDSDAKEAVAFAILANERLRGLCNNVPNATGARHPVVMGKVSI